MSATMRALRAHERGGSEGLRWDEVPVPQPGTGDVLVAVRASSYTPTELTWPSTWVDRAGHDRTPVIPCHEVSGVVAALGFGAAGMAVGDEVFGLTDWYRDGTAAEYVAVEARNLAPRPRTLTHAEAAAVPLAALTAWQGLIRHGGLRPGQTVLVHGAAGGVGTFAVQLAAEAGARVVATGRARDEALARDLGADAFLLLEELEGSDERADLVFDTAGGPLLRASWPLMRPGGTVISVAEQPVAEDAAGAGVRAAYFVVEPDRGDLLELSARLDAGTLRPVVGARCPARDARAMIVAKEHGGIPGKVVLTFEDETEPDGP